eukprot:TRINITY_DN116195_c0_g1_i1.p2 TRINITY_DN116195_c0_g1~~TRINITY_DN116195_c0_g1_i1.p2  ORF type:complete len:108 (+),score=11.43 TRINITY_DN116195_c0_g1_i1:65-388(+)
MNYAGMMTTLSSAVVLRVRALALKLQRVAKKQWRQCVRTALSSAEHAGPKTRVLGNAAAIQKQPAAQTSNAGVLVIGRRTAALAYASHRKLHNCFRSLPTRLSASSA